MTRKKHQPLTNPYPTLQALYEQTSFADEPDESVEWSDGHVDRNTDPTAEESSGYYIHVPQCSYLGSTLIMMGDTYEQHGEDALFIQELIRLYRAGKLEVIE